MNQRLGLDLRHVPYKDSAFIADMVNGIDAIYDECLTAKESQVTRP